MIYFDNAATSFPKPPGMAEAMMEHMAAWCGNPGRSGHELSRRTEAAACRACGPAPCLSGRAAPAARPPSRPKNPFPQVGEGFGACRSLRYSKCVTQW